jgi:hypothetical protein
MWTMLLLLWSIPLAAGILIFARVWEGNPALTDQELELFFGDRRPIDLSPRMTIEFVALALLFFMLGVFEGLVLENFGTVWVVGGPLMTGIGAMCILAYRLRSAPRESRSSRRKPAWANTSPHGIADLLRALNLYNRR